MGHLAGAFAGSLVEYGLTQRILFFNSALISQTVITLHLDHLDILFTKREDLLILIRTKIKSNINDES